MKLKNLLVLFIAVTTMFALQSCDDDSSSNNETARVQLKLVDAPGDYHAVMVNVVDVQYNLGDDVEGEGGWKSFTSFEGEQMIDLTELVGGVNVVLSDEIMPAGVLHQIRLVLGNGNTVQVELEDGTVSDPMELKTPSAQQSGLKLNLDTELEGGYSYTFVLDWDVQKSIVHTGSDNYILKPVIRVQAEANSGSIDGSVKGDLLTDALEEAVLLENVVVKLYQMGAMEGEEPYATTTTNSEGYFKFEGLPTVEYKMVIEVDGFDIYTMENVSVAKNEVTSVGTLELTLTE